MFVFSCVLVGGFCCLVPVLSASTVLDLLLGPDQSPL